MPGLWGEPTSPRPAAGLWAWRAQNQGRTLGDWRPFCPRAQRVTGRLWVGAEIGALERGGHLGPHPTPAGALPRERGR